MPELKNLAIAILIGVAATSCTSTAPGTPTTAPNSTSDESSGSSPTSNSPSGELPSDGAPKVKTPVDPGTFLKQPCLALTEDQLKTLELPAGKQRQDVLGEVCDWSNGAGGLIVFGFLEKNPRGLSGTYAANKAGKYKYFEELPDIEGQPAVAYDVLDRRSKGNCGLAIGITDKLMVDMSLSQSRDKIGPENPPCDVAVRVAKMILQTIKAGG